LIKIFDTDHELATFFASHLVTCIRETPDDRSFYWVLSGGTTPKLVFQKIASEFADQIDWKKVKIFWSDERCVGPEDNESNYKMAKDNLLDHVPVPSNNIFRIHGESNPAAEAVRYGEIFSRNVTPFQGIPQAGLLMLGLGEDGHTASIFPENIDLFNSDNLFEPSVHPVTKQKRITATGKIINRAKLVVILVTGESKASKAAQVIDQLNGWEQLPASMVDPEHGELLWLLDSKASEKL
jgi:6-phosphogluconolactonase